MPRPRIIANGNMKARWNQQRIHGVCPSTSPMNRTASEAIKAKTHASPRANSPETLFIIVKSSL
jgi:hypothetical protein